MPCYLFLSSQPNSNSELRSHQLEGSSFSVTRGLSLFQSCAGAITGGCTEQCSRAVLGLLVQIRFPLDARCLPVSLDRVYWHLVEQLLWCCTLQSVFSIRGSHSLWQWESHGVNEAFPAFPKPLGWARNGPTFISPASPLESDGVGIIVWPSVWGPRWTQVLWMEPCL